MVESVRISTIALCVSLAASISAAQVSLSELERATFLSILEMVEPKSGLPHDKLNRISLDLFPQFATGECPSLILDKDTRATFEFNTCFDNVCRHDGQLGLRFSFDVPTDVPGGTYGSLKIDPSAPFDACAAANTSNICTAKYLQLWAKGTGQETIEVLLWSDCGVFPDRPPSAVLTLTSEWKLYRIPLQDYQALPTVDLKSLCRISIAVNDTLDPQQRGTFYVDNIAFVTSSGERVSIPNDQETSTSNIALYLAALVAARDRGLLVTAEAHEKISKVIESIERLEKSHGFPQTHNLTISLKRDPGDTCIASADTGNLAVALIVVKNAVPELASRVDQLLKAMEWKYLFESKDSGPGPHPCVSDEHLASDNRIAHAIAAGSDPTLRYQWDRLNRDFEPGCCSPTPHLLPGWNGGGLFMQLYPEIFLDERGSLLSNSARAFVQDQMCEAYIRGHRVWGVSATALPGGIGYCESAGYCGFGCTKVGANWVAPYASLLAVEMVTPEALEGTLVALQDRGARPLVNDDRDLGFVSSVSNHGEIVVSRVYLMIDQAMAFLALANYLQGDFMRTYACRDPLVPDYAGHCQDSGHDPNPPTRLPWPPTDCRVRRRAVRQ